MSHFARRLSIESLETRNLLAGNVLVSVNSGDLIIRGDNLSNSVSLVQVGSGSFRVAGFAANGQPTKINGGLNAVTVSGVNDDVFITMRAGYDIVNIGSTKPGSLVTSVPDDLTIDMGAGVDTVNVKRMTCNDVKTTMGAAAENNADTLNARKCTVSGNATFDFGGGNDVLVLADSRLTGALNVDLGSGNDDATINGGEAGSVNLLCGTGDDHGLFDGVLKVNGDVFADGGEGTDTAEEGENLDFTIGGSQDLVRFES